uniref:Uncharacterized protein n=1 Tax=viral metagenome TaxID=1070528 RepID=A0A6M3JL51_9ZZZZ
MIAEAIEKIKTMAGFETAFFPIDGRNYSFKELHRIDPPDALKPVPLAVTTLDGVVDYVKASDSLPRNITVTSPRKVVCSGLLLPDYGNIRHDYIAAVCPSPTFRFDSYLPVEDFLLAIHTLFETTDDREKILKGLSNLSHAYEETRNDTGITAKLKKQESVSLLDEADITNPVVLKPFRTFHEIEQPKSMCILRIRKQGADFQAGLWCADGGLWELEAIRRIKKYLVDAELTNTSVIG